MAANAPTQMASMPPASAGDNAPTQLAPPPPPPPPLVGSTPPYSQYNGPAVNQGAPGAYPSGPSQPSYLPPPPGYASGPPPVMTPGGGVAPWAKPQKGRGKRMVLTVLLIILLLGGALGAGAFFLLHKSAPASHPVAGSTPGAASTPGAGNTPGSSAATQTLDNINRTGIYAGVMFTVVSATEAQQMPDFQNFNPDQDTILRIVVNVDYESSRHGGFLVTGRVMGPDGRLIDVGLGHGIPKDEVPGEFGEPLKATDAFYFEVPKAVKITDWTLVIGETSEVLVNIPLGGDYDPTLYQEIPHTMGLNQPIKYDNGNITGVITKIVTVTWNPCGCQAQKGTRFLRVYFHVTNNTAAPVLVGDGDWAQYLLIYPNGDRKRADTQFNAPIGVMVAGAESKDVGFDSWVIPSDPAPYTIVFLNPDLSKAGQVDFGTL
ncbi:MAG TPA: hypothetical protein VH599_05485 [Ktedonobacterales bacterium]